MRMRQITFVFMWWLLLAGLSVLDAYAADYKLAMSEKNDVCQLVLKFSNDRFTNKGLSSFAQLENLPLLEAPEFKLAPWESTAVNSSLADRQVSSAFIDINNDGQPDWVVKTEWYLSSQISERLDIYANRSEPFAKELDYKDLDRADRHLDLTGQTYYLKKIAPHKFEDGTTRNYWIGGVFKLILFRFRNITYILIVTPGLASEVLLAKRKFAAVTKYTASFELQDVCYLEELRNER